MKLSELKPSERKTILVYGDSGAGKTVFSCSAPGPIFVYDFDGKISSAASFYQGTEKINEIEYLNCQPKDEKGSAFQRMNDHLGELKKDMKYKTIVLDSLTTMSDEMMKYSMGINPGIKRAHTKGVVMPVLQDYGMFRVFMKQFITAVLALPCNIIFTAHIMVEKDETTGQILRSPMMAGKLSRELPIYFEEVYRAFVKDGKYWAQTQSDNHYQCRSQIKGLPKEVELKWESLNV